MWSMPIDEIRMVQFEVEKRKKMKPISYSFVPLQHKSAANAMGVQSQDYFVLYEHRYIGDCERLWARVEHLNDVVLEHFNDEFVGVLDNPQFVLWDFCLIDEPVDIYLIIVIVISLPCEFVSGMNMLEGSDALSLGLTLFFFSKRSSSFDWKSFASSSLGGE